MADAAVGFLLENLKQLLLHHAKLIGSAKSQVEMLQNNLNCFKDFLMDAAMKQRKDNRTQGLIREMRAVVSDAEDIIDTFVITRAQSKTMNYFSKVWKQPGQLLAIANQVQAICDKIAEIKGDKDRIDMANLSIEDGEPDNYEAPPVREKNVVGLEKDAATIKNYLSDETPYVDVISIVGMPGLGKTTLTRKIFLDQDIHFQFPTRIWVYVSQKFTIKGVFLDILKQMVNQLDEDTYKKKEAKELAKEIANHLDRGKCLIVLDDVWATEDWTKLQDAFKTSNNMCKVLITSRNIEVARSANKERKPYELNLLDLKNSWLLLQYEVFGKPECPSGLEMIGQRIANQCNGLPLAIVVIGGILATKFSASSDSWETVSKSVNAFLNEDPQGRMKKIISLSYDKLPYHLRECFLYLGMFPNGFDIPVWKLIRMWIAEGLIQSKDGINLEGTAEYYLNELINRNLVRAEKLKADGRVKTCRIHDMLRDFCKTEAASENFLQEIKFTDEGFKPPVSEVQRHRRVCIHSDVLRFLSERYLYGPRVRSLVCFPQDEVNLPVGNSGDIPTAFKLLRILEANPIKFTKIPPDFYCLLHLRYIVLTFNPDQKITQPAVLPRKVSELWSLQTLVVNTAFQSLEVKADILNFSQLRHFKTNAAATLLKPDKKCENGEKIQTLGTISPESCTVELFEKASNIKNLGIRGKLALLLNGQKVSFDSLGKLANLEKLKLLNDVFPNPRSQGKLGGLPPANKFPSKLRTLVLSDTFLDWSRDMRILGSLDMLRVLKLKNDAFVGETWRVVTDGGFCSLEVLHIEQADLTFWVASASDFPILKSLKLKDCGKLQAVPIGFANIPSLRLLDLNCTRLAVASAKEIREAKKGKLELTIFPADRE